MSSYTRMRPRTGPRTGQEPKTSQYYWYIPVLGGSVIQFSSGSLLVLWPVIYMHTTSRDQTVKHPPPALDWQKIQMPNNWRGTSKELTGYSFMKTSGFLEGFETPGVTQFFDCWWFLKYPEPAVCLILMFFKYPDTADSWILIFEIPRTDWFFSSFFSKYPEVVVVFFLKKQITTQHWYIPVQELDRKLAKNPSRKYWCR